MKQLRPKSKGLLSITVLLALVVTAQSAISQTAISNNLNNTDPQLVNTSSEPITSTTTPKSEKYLISVFPNPASANITVLSTQPMHFISIINILGSTVKQFQPDQLQAKINIADLIPD